jgi:hypothetical protein
MGCPGSSEARFHETLMQRLRRFVLATACALHPNRIALMPRLIRNLKRLLRQGKVTMDQTSKA